MRVAIIGGGAAGMMAALTALEDKNNSVVLFERQSRLGRKLAATGNGRCNLTNMNAGRDSYHGENPEFVAPALGSFGVPDTLAFFRSLGLLTTAEESGRVYPLSDSANSVVDVLRLALEGSRAELRLGAEVTKLTAGFKVWCGDEYVKADRVIVTAGGAAGSGFGGGMWGYELLSELGHGRTKLYPSLVQIKTVNTHTRALKGIRADAGVSLTRGKTELAASAGEVQFLEYGISGPAIFEISRAAAQAGDGLSLRLDLLRGLDTDEICSILADKRKRLPELALENLLTGLVHNRLGRVVIRYGGRALTAVTGKLSDSDLRSIASDLKAFELPVIGTRGFDSAQVTAGGLRVSEFDPQTLESRLVPGLYAAGELLDVDGDCGGFNLQWAWSSGRLAGKLGRS